MSSAPPPPPPPRGPPAGGGGAGGAPHPLSRFASRPAAGAPGAAASVDAAARRSNLLSGYGKYASPVGIGATPAGGGEGVPPPPPPPTATAAPTPPAAGNAAPPPPPPAAAANMGNGYPAALPSSLPLWWGAAPSPPPPRPQATLPRMGAIETPSAPPPPPPPPPQSASAAPGPAAAGAAGAAAMRGPRAGAPGARYATPPAFATGASTAATAGPPPPSPPQAAAPPPPPSSAAAPSSLTQPPPPAMATRVSGAALPRPASSRTSSNGRQTPRDVPCTHADNAAEKPSMPTHTFLAEAGRREPHHHQHHTAAPAVTTASAEAVAHRSRPSSRGSSTHAVAPAAAAGASTTLHGRRPSVPSASTAPAAGAGLHRSIPSFLQPGGDGVRTPRGSTPSSNPNTAPPAASRGRELLEAALMSRGSRRATSTQLQQDRNSESVSLSGNLEQAGAQSANNTAPPEQQQQQQPRDESALALAGGGAVSGSGGDAVPKPFAAPPAAAIAVVPPIPSLSSPPQSMEGDEPSSLGVGFTVAEERDGGEKKDSAGAPARPMAEESSGRTTGAMSSVKSGASTTASGVQDCRSATVNATASVVNTNPFAAATGSHVNPFRAVPGRSSGVASTLASPPPPGARSRDKAAGPPPPLPQYTPFTGSAASMSSLPVPPVPAVHVPPVPQPQAPPPPPAAPPARAPVPSYLSGTASTRYSSAVAQLDTVKPAMPSLPKPQQSRATTAAAAGAPEDTTAVGPTAGFITPRGGRDDDAARPHGQAADANAAPPLPPPVPLHPGTGQRVAPPSISRGPFAASPYIREEEDKRTAADESPMPLRPPSFDSVAPLDDSAFADGDDANGVDAAAAAAAGQNVWPDEAGETGHMAQPAPPLPTALVAEGHGNPFNAPLHPPPAPATAPRTAALDVNNFTGHAFAFNPFLEPQEDGPFAAAAAITTGAAPASQPNHAAPPPPPSSSAGDASAAAPPGKLRPSLVSGGASQVLGADISALAPPQAMSLRSPNNFTPSEHSSRAVSLTRPAAPPLFAEDDAEAPSVYGTATTSVTSAAARTPANSTLVNPFSKSAHGAAAAAAAAAAAVASVVNGAAGTVASGGASLTGSFAGAGPRKRGRATGAPCFAIFVGGARLPPGLPVSRGGDGPRPACIAACFNDPRASPPMAGGGALRISSPQGKGIATASSHSSLTPTTSLSGTTRVNPTPLPRAVSTSAVAGGGGGSCISFCSVTEALTARGSVVDRKGIRGTERGRRYVRALTGAVLPCALGADGWNTDDASTLTGMSEVLEALQSCAPAPLCDVMAVMLKDAFPQGAEDAFAWRSGGGRRLAELLTAAAQADTRRQAAMATVRSPLSAAAGGNSSKALVRCGGGSGNCDPLGSFTSPLNGSTGMVGAGAKERAAALRKVEDLVCLGDRVEAVETALQAHLFAHALLISMMCPTKDLYMRTVQAVMQQELSVETPLSHAYSLFNEMPLPPLVPPPPPPPMPPRPEEAEGDKQSSAASGVVHAAAQERHEQALVRRDRAAMEQSWCRHAAMLLANFTRHSGEGLMQLAMTLQRLQLVVEAHTCLLLLHLTPLGMAGPSRAGAEPLPPLSSLSPEDIEDLMPRPDQRQAMEEIRRHLGVVGGMYHPTQGCRAMFLTPATTVLTQLVQLVSARLDARAPPLPPAAPSAPPVPFHGLPGGQPRGDVGYRMMQVLWLRELGLVKEAAQALQALLQRMPPPLAFSLRAPPRTLNELVYLFGSVPVPTSSREEAMEEPQELLATSGHASAPGSRGTTEAPFPTPSARGSSPPHGAAQQPPPPTRATPSLPTTPEERRGGPLQQPPPPPPHPSQSATSRTGPPPPPPTSAPEASAASAPAPLTREQRAAALQPPARPLPSKLPPPPQQQHQQPEHGASSPPPPPSQQHSPPSGAPLASPAGNKATPPAPAAGAKSKPAAPAPRRSRSIDALRNFFFRRGNSEAAAAGDNNAAGEKKTEEAKPMHLDTEKPPAFDPVTGRWLFAETEEEKRLRELAKAGPPKMAPKTAPAAEAAPASTPTPPAAPAPQGPASPPPPAGMQASPPGAVPQPRPGPGAPAPGRPSPLAGASGGMPAPRPAGSAPVMGGRGAPPPTMGGRGPARHGGRPQYVDMFNSTN